MGQKDSETAKRERKVRAFLCSKNAIKKRSRSRMGVQETEKRGEDGQIEAAGGDGMRVRLKTLASMGKA